MFEILNDTLAVTTKIGITEQTQIIGTFGKEGGKKGGREVKKVEKKEGERNGGTDGEG